MAHRMRVERGDERGAPLGAGPLDGFGDNYFVPLGVGGTFAINSALDVRAQFTLDRLIAANNGGADARTLSIGAAWRM
jgi:hypothetical protein